MASLSYLVSATATATLIWQTTTGVSPDPAPNPSAQIFRCGTFNDPVPILVRNEDATNLVTLGGVGVVSGVGVSLRPGESLTFNATGSDSMYAITASATVHVSVLAQRQ